MITLKHFLKSLLKPGKEKEDNSSDESTVALKNADESNNTINSLSKNSQDETEIHEDDRNPNLDSAPDQETAHDADKQESGGSQLSGNDNGNDTGGKSRQVEPDKGEKKAEPEKISKSLTPQDLENAYQKGLIEGRNRKIETIFFSDKEKVPHFKSSALSLSPSADIFSLAREA